MNVIKKIVFGILLIASPMLAFDFGNKMDQLADSFSNKMFDKAVDGVENAMNGNTSKSKQQQTSSSKSNKMQQLKELIEMKKQGYITDSEFRAQKKIILSQK